MESNMTKSYTGGHPLESVVGDIAKERDAAIARAEAAERRVAELEARLAGEAWRPVTEKPEKSGHYLAYDADGEQFLFAGVCPYRVARWDGKWNSGLNGLNDYWRPLPPPPTATE
jgi:hypothetical protein